MSIEIAPLADELSFGARITGITMVALQDEVIRFRLRDAFLQHGLLLFQEVEPTAEMQLRISTVFGPLKDHPKPKVARVDKDGMLGVIEINTHPDNCGIVEIGGRQLSHWLPWHFDHCYNDELNLAGVLRAVEIAPEGGLTGFVDGIDLYRSFPADLLAAIEGEEVIYHLAIDYFDMKFGRPKDLRVVRPKPGVAEASDYIDSLPDAVHPTVWMHGSGRKALHVSPWMAIGLVGKDRERGDALLEEVCQSINAIARERAYHHRWGAREMLVWDNTRMLHSVGGMDPGYRRSMHRTTIAGDYGLGRWAEEQDASAT